MYLMSRTRHGLVKGLKRGADGQTRGSTTRLLTLPSEARGLGSPARQRWGGISGTTVDERQRICH